MTNQLALFLIATILAALVFDYVMFDLQGSLFMAKKATALIEYLAFWR